jgi:NTP pyrophosphatase (non-canonical NTP hydrolase)
MLFIMIHGGKMEKRTEEIMHIAQEECAEVTQAISKVFRFGFTATHNGKTNKEHLEEELGDLVAMIRLLIADKVVDEMAINRASLAKLEKLHKWSTYIRMEEK